MGKERERETWLNRRKGATVGQIGVTVGQIGVTVGQIGVTVGQWLAGPSFNQGVGGAIPALVDLSLSKTLNPELLPVAAVKLLWLKASAKCPAL